MSAARAICLDASVLVKLHTDEPDSGLIRGRCATEPVRYTTPFCFYEALNVFKSKWKYQGKLDATQYRKACTSLSAWYGGICRAGLVRDADLTNPEAFRAVHELVERIDLDLSDAFQIISVKYGYFSILAGESRTVLATTDRPLAAAARSQGISVWNVALEVGPQ